MYTQTHAYVRVYMYVFVHVYTYTHNDIMYYNVTILQTRALYIILYRRYVCAYNNSYYNVLTYYTCMSNLAAIGNN